MERSQFTIPKCTKEMVRHIRELIEVHSIHVMSLLTENTHRMIFVEPASESASETLSYTLLLITEKPFSGRIGDLRDRIDGRMKGRCRVHIMIRPIQRVKKRLDHGDPFLKNVLTNGVCIYKRDNGLNRHSLIESGFHKRIYEELENSYSGHMHRAGYLIGLAETVTTPKDATSQVMVLHHAMVQVCLALLVVFWQYRPTHYSLRHLLHLCGHFTELFTDILPNDSFNSQRLRYILFNINHIILFKSGREYTDADADAMLQRCIRFHGGARKIAMKQLKMLKAKHCGLDGSVGPELNASSKNQNQ